MAETGRRNARDANVDRICVAQAPSPALAGSQTMIRARAAALVASADSAAPTIAAGLQAILLSPRFLFRVEANPGAGRNAPLDDYEIASRLSYFLWSSMPDDQLFARATGGALHDGASIVDEVRRMLADPRSSALVDNLAGEWLGSRQMAVQQVTLPDVTFDAALRDAMAAEASLFLGEMFRGEDSHPSVHFGQTILHRVAEKFGGTYVFNPPKPATNVVH